MNEEEALPFWQLFQDASGVKVSYVRSSDANILARIAIEYRARQRSWDLVATTPVYRLPDEVLLQFDPPEAKNLIPQARAANRRWYGVYGNYNAPSYNTNFVKKADLPKTYEEFLDSQGMGRPGGDRHHRLGMAERNIQPITARSAAASSSRISVATLKPVVVDGHLVVARSVGAGEYWVALNNYVGLTTNVMLSGAPTDFWPLDPVGLAFGSIGVREPGAAPQGGAARRQFRAEPRGPAVPDQAGPPADPNRRRDQSARRDRCAAEEEGHRHHLLGRAAEEDADDLQRIVPRAVTGRFKPPARAR